MNAHDGLPVRLVAHDMGLRRELEEPAVSRVLVGVVLVGEVPPHSLDADELSPLELLDERDTVEALQRRSWRRSGYAQRISTPSMSITAAHVSTTAMKTCGRYNRGIVC